MIFVIETKDIERQQKALLKWFNISNVPRAYKMNLLASYKLLSSSDNPEHQQLFYELFHAVDELKL